MNLQYFSDSVVDKEKALRYCQIERLIETQDFCLKQGEGAEDEVLSTILQAVTLPTYRQKTCRREFTFCSSQQTERHPAELVYCSDKRGEITS